MVPEDGPADGSDAPVPLECPSCGSTYPDRWRCACGHPLEFAERPLPDGPALDPAAFDARDGLWAFEAFLPVERGPTLGEGFTPLADAAHWDAAFKLDYVFPTGSFKDRGATTTLSRAAELGVERVVEDSSGNAGAAIAVYAARAGIDAEVYVPAGVAESKLKTIERSGAVPVPVEGSREDVTAACVEAVEAGDAWYASHAWNPAFFAGTATVAYEIAAQRDWSVPDAVVAPLGHGTLFLGAYRGFRALRDAGWTDRVPRLLGAQAAGYAPVADALRSDDDGVTGADAAGDDDGVIGANGAETDANDLADGIQIRDPVREAAVHRAIEETGGDAVALSAAAVERELDALHRRGFYVEPTAATGPAALRAYRDRGVVGADDDVVVALTGSGLKS